MPRWIPTLKGLIPDRVEQAIIFLFRQLYELSDRVDGMKGMARAELDYNRIKMALEIGGESPLNVAQLLGVLAQPQMAGAPTVTTLPGINDPQSQDGALVGYLGAIYRFSETTGTWIATSGSVSSVAFTAAPSSVFDVAGTPITSSGTIALSMDTQTANKVLASPSSGAAAVPAFRALVAADMPSSIVAPTYAREFLLMGA